MAGLPVLTIRCGLSDGMPVGLQLFAAAWSELLLLRAARAYEAITAEAAWRTAEPPGLSQLEDPAGPTPMERAGRAAA
jgi:Asp-tRNA(Asn)/Glu-tRNA(Gln) amidotransferase A subunit family amidase